MLKTLFCEQIIHEKLIPVQWLRRWLTMNVSSVRSHSDIEDSSQSYGLKRQLLIL